MAGRPLPPAIEEGVATLNRRLADFGGEPGRLGDAIALIYQMLAEIPIQWLQDFDQLGEADLVAGQSERMEVIAAGRIEITYPASLDATILDAARLLRALEQVAMQFGRTIESDLGADLEDAWRVADGHFYLVPRLRPLTAIDRKPFLRRALLHHRVLPTSVNGLVVRLHRSPWLAETAALRSTEGAHGYGAAFFPGLAVELSSGDSDFTVTGLTGFAADTLLAAHLAEAEAAGCRAIVWAELTMPENAVDQLRSMLRDRILDYDTAPLAFLVAGSWHREVDGVMRNVGRVLDGGGDELLQVMKWAKFKIGGRKEAIEPGGEIPVLVLEDELNVLAICRDFLEGLQDVPYRMLNVDAAIVPSMGSDIDDLDTMRGHGVTADAMRVRFGTRTLVVMQPALPAATMVGRVLDFPAKPLREDGDLVDGPWRLCVFKPF